MSKATIKWLLFAAVGLVAGLAPNQVSAQTATTIAAPATSPAVWTMTDERQPGNPSEAVNVALDYSGTPPMTQMAIMNIVMEEASTTGTPGKMIAASKIALSGPAPENFSLRYHPMALTPGQTYVVRVEISDQNQVVWASVQPYEVVNNGTTANVKVMMRNAAAAE